MRELRRERDKTPDPRLLTPNEVMRAPSLLPAIAVVPGIAAALAFAIAFPVCFPTALSIAACVAHCLCCVAGSHAWLLLLFSVSLLLLRCCYGCGCMAITMLLYRYCHAD